jgi:hypothetical protein
MKGKKIQIAIWDVLLTGNNIEYGVITRYLYKMKISVPASLCSAYEN